MDFFFIMFSFCYSAQQRSKINESVETGYKNLKKGKKLKMRIEKKVRRKVELRKSVRNKDLSKELYHFCRLTKQNS